MWAEYVIDGTMGVHDGMFCFCPVDGDSIVVGMNYISDRLPDRAKLVGIIHEGGDEAAELFHEQYKEQIARATDTFVFDLEE